MIKTYVKTASIQAERFDGSAKMAEQYGLTFDRNSVYMDSARHYYMKTLEGRLRVKLGNWIATGVNGEHWSIADDVFQKTYAELPMIPREVADYIQKAKRGTWGILDVFWYIGDLVSACGLSGVCDWQLWIVNHQDAVARAWLDGYRIEEAPDALQKD